MSVDDNHRSVDHTCSNLSFLQNLSILQLQQREAPVAAAEEEPQPRPAVRVVEASPTEEPADICEVSQLA